MTKNKNKIAESINILGDFCGIRDIDELTQEDLKNKFGISQVDAAVLFGGSILAGGDVFAETIKNNLAKKYIIVGGAGHTTETFREKISTVLNKKFAANSTEADLFNEYLKEKYNLQVDFLERESTNCGNNITFLLSLLQRENIPHKSVLMIQDSTMQRRMDASWRRYVSEQIIVNYAAYRVKVIVENDELKFEKIPLGMWDLERYIQLLMGDIARLQDNAEGYGPQGKNFIAHVDIPESVLMAFLYLKNYFKVREANPNYASTPTAV